MSATKELYFEPINFEKQKKDYPGGLNYDTTVKAIENGRKVYALEETGFIQTQFSGFAPKEINAGGKTYSFESNQRSYIKIPLNPEQTTCLELEEQINMYDDALHENFETTFGSYSKLFTHIRSVKEPKEADELDSTVNPDAVVRPRYKSCKIRLHMGWNYYLNGVMLNDVNSEIVLKTFVEARKKKIDANTLSVQLNLVNAEDGTEQLKEVRMKDIKQVKDKILTKVFYRRPETIVEGAKKVEDCTEDELDFYYGANSQVAVNVPDDLDKYYRHGCYIRLVYQPLKVYAQRNKGDDGKRKCGLIFEVGRIDIINTRQHSSSVGLGHMYENYVFKKTNVRNEASTTVVEEKKTVVETKPTPQVKKAVVEEVEVEEEES